MRGPVGLVAKPSLRHVLYGRPALSGEGSNRADATAARPLLEHDFFNADLVSLQSFEHGLSADER